jgi:hypothetical protein
MVKVETSDKIVKRFLGPGAGVGFFVKQEGELYWLGFQTEVSSFRRQISKELYGALMKEIRDNKRNKD